MVPFGLCPLLADIKTSNCEYANYCIWFIVNHININLNIYAVEFVSHITIISMPLHMLIAYYVIINKNINHVAYNSQDARL